MMNRRLRERLTEEEILQVFVDVCEVRRQRFIASRGAQFFAHFCAVLMTLL